MALLLPVLLVPMARPGTLPILTPFVHEDSPLRTPKTPLPLPLSFLSVILPALNTFLMVTFVSLLPVIPPILSFVPLISPRFRQFSMVAVYGCPAMPPECWEALTAPLLIQLVIETFLVAFVGAEPKIPPIFVLLGDDTNPWFSQLVIVAPPDVDATCPQIPPILSAFAVILPWFLQPSKVTSIWLLPKMPPLRCPQCISP